MAEGAIDLNLFGGELGEDGVVAAAIGFGDQAADLALAAFETASFESVESVFDLLSHGLGVVWGICRVFMVLES